MGATTYASSLAIRFKNGSVPMQVRLEKIILFSADVLRLVRFYQDYLGLRILSEPDENWTILDAGGTTLAFHKIGTAYQQDSDRDQPTPSNVKIVFETNQNLDAFRQLLIDNNIDVDVIRQFAGVNYRSFDGRDPEGNVFQVIQPFTDLKELS